MGLCFSKKKPPAAKPKPGKIAVVVSDDKAKKPAEAQQSKRTAGEATANKAAVFVVRPGSAKDAAAAAAPLGEDPKKKKRSSQEPAAPKQLPLPVVLLPSAPVRTSSCTKEEVDAILIQCGRLSRSSSGAGRAAAASDGGETGGGGHRRRRSGSKRSYDFDQEAARATGACAGGGADEEECDWVERQGVSSRPSPSPHRGSPQRKRSGSRERSGSRRASRSPGRRVDGAAASGVGDRARQQQPAKMVSVPAREKGRAPSPAAAAASGKRCASPRSSSPARMVPAGNENAGGGPAAGTTPVLSRSSSRKNEQSPYRRNPMAELDENSFRNNTNCSARPQKKSTETAVAATPKKATAGRGKEPTAAAVPSSCSGKENPEVAEDAAVAVVASETTRALHSSSSKTNATRTVSVVAESLTQSQRTGAQPGCRSRRASRDFDQNPGGGSYTTTQLLEDIHSYHHQQSQSTSAATPATPSLSLPACVAKACSIVEAVADLNSSSTSSSENHRAYGYEPGGGHSADDKGSVNAAPAGSGDFVEPSAAARKHLLVQPPVRRGDVRAETTEQPQESAGSNSVSGHPWTPSWEPTSVESSDRTWSTGDDEVVEQSGGSHGGGRCSPMNRPRQSKQRQSLHEPSGVRSRGGSGNGNGQYRGRSGAHRGSGGSSVASGRSGVRVVSANS